MSHRIAFVWLALLAAACAGTSEPLRREETQVTEFRAQVAAVDLGKRLVTLRDASGGEATFRADEGVRNLPQVRVGDELVGSLVESIALELREPTPEEQASDAQILEVTATAQPGEKPAGFYVRQIRAVLTVEGIDRAAGTATLRGPAGNSRTIAARNPANLERVKVGDTVVATYTEALRLEVVPPAAP